MTRDPPGGASRLQQIGLALLGLGMTALGLYILSGFLRALVWAAIFAVALKPLYGRAERRWPPGRHNLLLPAAFTLGVALLFVVPLVIVGVQLSHEARGLAGLILDAQKTGVPVPAFVAGLPFGGAVAAWWQANLGDPDNLAELLGHINRDQLMAYGETFGRHALHGLVQFGFTILTLFFLFRDGDALGRQMSRAAVRAFGHRGGTVGAQIVASVHGTVDGLVLVGLGEGIMLGVAYWIAGVPHPTMLGAATAVAAMVPFGAPIAFGAAALFLLAQGAVAAAVAVFALGVVVSFAADHFVRPVLIGGATKLPFLWVLLGILGGVESFGLLGLFLGPAVMSTLILLWREWAGDRPPDA